MHPNNAGHRLLARLLRGQLLAGGPRPRGSSLPFLDLASDFRRQTIVDREPGQYLGHPTTVLLDDARTMLCVYPKGHGRGGIVYKRSTDGGLTWSERLPVPHNWETSQEVPTLFRAESKRLVMFSGLYPIRMAVSEDEGVTWTPLKPIGDFGGIVAMGDMTRLRDGRFLALFHDDGRFLRDAMTTGPFHVYKTVSSDGCLTWSEPEAMLHHPVADLCEPGLVRSPDGRQLAVLLRENARLLNSFVAFSDDEGETWTEPVELPGALTGDRHTARYDADGRLVVVFRDTAHESPTRGDFVAWIGRYEDLRTGAEGQYRVRLLDNTMGADCGYPGLERLPDGTFVATTYGHWIQGEPPFVVSTRFRLAELDALATSRSRGRVE
ncbi:MAG: exo-alpha-sialidase [Bryobacterales bacterium]|nr:exo-alpha-sialidase [Bryobacterales bacterium]